MILKEWHIRKASSGPIAYTIPVEMANFLKNSGLSGNLFNDYGIGGYLVWALYPQWKTFIDGRNLDANVSRHYKAIAFVSMDVADGKPLYEMLIEQYQIDVIAMRTSVSNGNLQPLLRVLLSSPDWTPVFQDWMSFVLVRNTPNNKTPIQQHGIDKSLFVESMLETTISILRTNPGNKTFSLLYNDLVALKTVMGDRLHNSHEPPIR
jgi:hypothetical protein